MLNVRQIRGNWNDIRIQQIVDAAIEQEIFSYFESNDGQTQWIGIGSTSRIYPEGSNNRFLAVEKWFKLIKKEIPNKIDLDSLAIFGGFSFDQNSATNDLWGEWSQGVFILPRIIIKITPEITIISENKKHIFSSDSIENVLDKMIQMAKPTHKLHSYSIEDLDPSWDELVDTLVEKINLSKPLKKVVLGRYKRGVIDGSIDPIETLKTLRALNKTTYHYMLKIKDQFFLSATPERLFKLEGNLFTTAAIAGTVGRGENEQEDNQLALSLYQDDKNRNEHQIVVNEIVSRISEFADDIEKSDQPMILKNQTVQHLYTPIQAKITDDINAFHLIKKMHPTPALGGFPAKESLQLIRTLESQPRVLFGSPVGYITLAGNSEMIVGIRSMYLNQNKFLLFAGAGIMPDSVGKEEFSETELKFQPMIQLLNYLEAR